MPSTHATPGPAGRTAADPAHGPANQDFLGHPKGLYVCFFTEMWERFSFYGMKALLLLYVLKYHLFGDDAGYDLLGAYGGLVYAVPVIGGLVADRWLGMRKAVVFGGSLLVLGHLGMAYEGHAAKVVDGVTVRDDFALQVFYLSLALIIMGVGFLKPNISTIVGRLYPENDPRRDSGFTLFAAGINVGAMFASLICAYLGETFGWKYGFGAAGVGMLAGLAMFLWGQKYLLGHAEPANPALLREKVGPITREAAIYLGGIAGVLVVWQLIQRTATVHGAMHIIAAGFAAWFVWFLVRHCDRVQRLQMLTLVALIVGVLLFYSLYEQTYGAWITYTDRLSTKNFFGQPGEHGGLPWAFWSLVLSPPLMIAALKASDRGHKPLAVAMVVALCAGIVVAIAHDVVLVPQTAGSLTFLGAFFLVVLAPLFSWLWPFLDRHKLNPSKPAKMAFALIASGLSFWPLLMGANAAAGGELASVWWLVLAYLILEIGEICLLPIGMSAVTQLSVGRVVGLMMGAFWLATAYSEVLAAQFSKLASLKVPEGEALNFAEASARYGELFGQMIGVGLATGLVALLLVPLLKRGMHGVK